MNIERNDVLQLLSCFDRPDEAAHQADAIPIFTNWLKHPEEFRLDDDLRERIEAIIKNRRS